MGVLEEMPPSKGKAAVRSSTITPAKLEDMVMRMSLDQEVINTTFRGQAVRREDKVIGKGKERAVEASFTTDGGRDDETRHFVKIDNVSPVTLDNLQVRVDSGAIGTVLHRMIGKSEGKVGKVHILLCFDDLRDAAMITEIGRAIDPTLEIAFISDSWFTDMTGLKTSPMHTGTSKWDGQVAFSVRTAGEPLDSDDLDAIQNRMLQLAAHYGNIMYHEFTSPSVLRCEYFKISSAKAAVTEVVFTDPHWFNDSCYIVAESFFKHLNDHGKTSASPTMSMPSPHNGTTPPDAIAGPADVKIHISPSGRSAWTYDDAGNIVNQQAPKVVPRAGPGASTSHELVQMQSPTPQSRFFQSVPTQPSPAMADQSALFSQRSTSDSFAMGDDIITRIHSGTVHGNGMQGNAINNNSMHAVQAEAKDTQDVQPERILNGQDVRTTVMIRNLPNNWTCDDMKDVLDRVSFGMYDFAYLRIDFQRNMNVGYGFVNFTDANAIIPFCKAYQHKDWQPQMVPSKRGQISYATVQGLDCLIEKFRNSAIMDECPGYRPKLFFTYDNAPAADLVGTEKKFPGPNNFTKKQRSADNAGQVGLYAPRSGGRDNRARRSNWDRGTPRQLQEDASYYAHPGPAFQQQYMNPAQAPIGTPMSVVPYGQPNGYAQPPMGQPFFPPAGFPQMDGNMAFNGMGQYPAPFPVGMPYGNYPGYAPFAGPSQAPGGYNTVNRASNLRTLSGGRLATRPRANVTVADPSRYDPAPGIPRSFNSTGNGDFVPNAVGNAQYGDHQYGDHQYYAANNGYEHASSNGIHFNHPQY